MGGSTYPVGSVGRWVVDPWATLCARAGMIFSPLALSLAAVGLAVNLGWAGLAYQVAGARPDLTWLALIAVLATLLVTYAVPANLGVNVGPDGVAVRYSFNRIRRIPWSALRGQLDPCSQRLHGARLRVSGGTQMTTFGIRLGRAQMREVLVGAARWSQL